MPTLNSSSLQDHFARICSEYPSLLEDRERFYELTRSPEFVSENCRLYDETTRFLDMIGFEPQLTGGVDPESYLKDLQQFVGKWSTRPISKFLFLDDSNKKSITGIELSLQWIWDNQKKTETIKIYPWTTEVNVRRQFKEIRKKKQDFRKLNSRDVITCFRAYALKIAKWTNEEIVDHLNWDGPQNNAYRTALESGKTPQEAERISEQAVGAFERTADAVRKRHDTASELVKWFISQFEQS